MQSQCLLGENRASIERRPEPTSRFAAGSVDGQIRDMRRPRLRSCNICSLGPDIGTAERTHRNPRPVLVARKAFPIDGGGRPKAWRRLLHRDEAWASSEESAPADYSPKVGQCPPKPVYSKLVVSRQIVANWVVSKYRTEMYGPPPAWKRISPAKPSEESAQSDACCWQALRFAPTGLRSGPASNNILRSQW